MWTDLSSILSQCTRVTDGQTDGQTDGRAEFSSLYRACIRGTGCAGGHMSDEGECSDNSLLQF